MPKNTWMRWPQNRRQRRRQHSATAASNPMNMATRNNCRPTGNLRHTCALATAAMLVLCVLIAGCSALPAISGDNYGVEIADHFAPTIARRTAIIDAAAAKLDAPFR